MLNLPRFLVLALPVVAAFSATGMNGRSNPAAPTYAKDVAPILIDRCVSCHGDTKIAPFSLVGYENAKKRARTIVAVTESGYMPPWKAKPHYGEFKDVQALTPQQKKILAKWVDAGMPAGNLAEAPIAPPVAPGWRLGKPDLIVAPTKATKIPAEGRDFFRDYLIDPKIDKPTWVRAIDFLPSNQGTVHHIIPSLATKEEADKLRKVKYTYPEEESWDGVEIDTYNTLGFWSTGASPFVSPDGTAFLIKPGDCFVLNVHYKPKGKVEMEQPQVAIYTTAEPPKEEMSVNVVATGGIYLQPNEAGQRVYAIGPKMKHPATIHAVWPHMHYLGRTFKAWVKYPAGFSKPLVAIDDWDPEWQLLYYLKTPMRVPAGSRIYVTGTYDNTTNNPRNPNSPPKVVEGGESSRDEMLFFELFWVEEKPPEVKKPANDPNRPASSPPPSPK